MIEPSCFRGLARLAGLALVLALPGPARAEPPPASQAGPPTPHDSPLTMRDVMSSPIHRDLMTAKLAVGDPAYDFTLPRLHRKGAQTRPGRPVSLASFRGRRPVALIFGSYT